MARAEHVRVIGGPFPGGKIDPTLPVSGTHTRPRTDNAGAAGQSLSQLPGEEGDGVKIH